MSVQENIIHRKRFPVLSSRGYASLGILFAIVAVYVVIQWWNFTPAFLEPDPTAYVWTTHKFTQGELPAVRCEDPFLFQEHMWVRTDAGEIAPKFAPGYPALMTPFYMLGGYHALYVLSPLMGVFSLIGVFLLFRQWLSLTWSAVALVILLINYYFLFYTGYLLTHAANLCFTVWGMYALCKWRHRPGIGVGFVAGILLGVAAAVRFTSLLLFCGLIVVVVYRFFACPSERKKTLLRAAWPGIGAFLVLAPVAYYNTVLFGFPIKTGYALSGEQTAFSLDFLLKNIETVATGFNSSLVPVLFPVALLGAYFYRYLFAKLFWFAWILPQVLVYASYYWAPPSSAYYRFFICTIPPFIVMACIALEYSFRLSRNGPQDMDSLSTAERIGRFYPGKILLILCLFVVYVVVQPDGMYRAFEGNLYGEDVSRVAEIGDRVINNLAEEAVLFTARPCSHALRYRTDMTVYRLRSFRKRYGRREFREQTVKHPRSADPRRQAARTEKFREFYSNISKQELVRRFQNIVRRAIEKERSVALFLPRSKIRKRKRFMDGYHLKELETYTLKRHFYRGRSREQEWVLASIRKDAS